MERKKHKYIAKIEKGKTTRYFYTMKEYQAYLKGTNKKQNVFSGIKNTLTNVLNSVNSIFNKPVNKNSSAIERGKKYVNSKSNQKIGLSFLMTQSMFRKAKSFVESLINNKKSDSDSTLEKDHKYIQKVKLPNGKYRYFYSEKEYESYLKRQEYQNNEPDFMKNVPESKDIKDENGEMAEINEKYPRDGYTENCMYCTTAYELRQRGYDVEANYRDEGGPLTDLYDWYKDPVIYTLPTDPKEIEEGMKYTYPPNSRGNFMVIWKEGGGHSMVWETDKSGELTIRDCQTNDVYDVSDITPYISDAYCVRTDNLEIKEAILDTVKEN